MKFLVAISVFVLGFVSGGWWENRFWTTRCQELQPWRVDPPAEQTEGKEKVWLM